MCHIANLINQLFKSIIKFERNYDYIYKIYPAGQEEKIFKFREWTFAILLSHNVKRCGLSIWTNVNPLHPGMLYAKFVDIGPVVLYMKIF